MLDPIRKLYKCGLGMKNGVAHIDSIKLPLVLQC